MMAGSKASTVEEYLSELPADRREVVSSLRNILLHNLPEGYEETMSWGMICYEVPLSIFPETYNGKPLMYAALGAQKKHYAVYLSSVYQDPEKYARLEKAFLDIGKKGDMGKSCVRFKKIEDLPLEAIGNLIAETDMDSFIDNYLRSRQKKGR